jgi:hypothetical protein
MPTTRSAALLIVTTIAVAAAVSGTALAAPQGAKGDPVTDKARELHGEGDVLYEKGDFARARAAYLGAWLLKKHWQIALNLGDTEVRLGLYRDAAEHLAYYLRESANAEPPPPPGGKKLYDEARAKVGALEITSDAGGAEIAVDGKVVGVTPLEDPIFVEPGEHTIEARRGEGFVASTITVEKGEARPVAMNLGVMGPQLEPPPPSHPTEAPRPSLVPIVIGGALGVVGVGVGIGFTVAANGKSSDIDGPLKVGGGERSACYRNASEACATLGDAVNDLDAFTSVAVAGYAVGVASVAATAAYVLWPRAASETKAGVSSAAPWVMPGGGGLGVAGRF